MARIDGSGRGTYLPTGWRVVGSGAERVAERAAAYGLQRIQQDDDADTLFAVRCTLEPLVRGRPVVEPVLAAITDDIRRTWADCPRLLRDVPVERPPTRFGGVSFGFRTEPGIVWLGEVVWRAVHPMVAGAPITTRVVLEEHRSYTRLSVRVTADDGLASVRGYVGAGQAQPPFLRGLKADLTPVWAGAPLEPRYVRNGEVADLVHSLLPAVTRDVPLVVLAPLEDGNYIVDPNELAWELLGRGQLHVLQEHRQTFELTDAIGDRRLSCYWGAARAYMPGWSRHDDPYDHPLLVGDRLGDPLMRAVWLGELGVWLGSRLTMPPALAGTAAVASPEVPAAAASGSEAGVSADVSRTGVRPSGARIPAGSGLAPAAPAGAGPAGDVPDAAWPVEAFPLLEALVGEVRTLSSRVAGLVEEVERLRTISAVRSSSTGAIERRLSRLEDLLAYAFPDGPREGQQAPGVVEVVDPEPADEGAPSLVAVVHHAAEAYSDALVVLESAFTAAADSPYEDPERVRAVLEAMARMARRRRDGQLGTSLRDAFNDLGIDYRGAIARSTSAKHREQYLFARGDQLVEAEEHIVLGNTYDPRRCLRVYFSSRVPDEPRFVIAHVGRHFQVRSST
jgi:hypothetical protein